MKFDNSPRKISRGRVLNTISAALVAATLSAPSEGRSESLIDPFAQVQVRELPLSPQSEEWTLEGYKDMCKRVREGYDNVSNSEIFKLFCQKYPKREGVDMQLTNKIFSLLTDTNDRINKKVKYRTDLDMFSDEDRWEGKSVTRGDCEEYAMSKYRALIKAGVSPNNLSITITKHIREDGIREGHVVLLVKVQTSQGERYLVLDNINEKVLPLETREDLIFYSLLTNGIWYKISR